MVIKDTAYNVLTGAFAILCLLACLGIIGVSRLFGNRRYIQIAF